MLHKAFNFFIRPPYMGQHKLIRTDTMTASPAESTNARGQQHKPVEIRLNREDNKLEVDFASGEKISLTAELLRVESPSAEIQGHSPDEKKIIGGRKNVAIMELKPVGNYAIEIKFDDLHDSGIYTWDYLFEMGRDQDAVWAEYLKNLEASGLKREP